MKTILLQFKHDNTLKPQRWNIEFEGETGLSLVRKNIYGSKDHMTVTRTPEGEFKNVNSVLYVQVKQDRRPKPFAIIGREEGQNLKRFTEKFATLQEAQAYIKARWQGMEYVDGSTSFHDDYSSYELVGFQLGDLGSSGTGSSEYYNWTWKNLEAQS